MGKRGPKPWPGLLTPRELEVLALITEGLSNPEIGDRLAISRDGVKFHVSEILSKLCVDSREEAARLFARHERDGRWPVLLSFVEILRRLGPGLAPLGVKAVAAAVLVSAVAGIGILAWGATRSSAPTEGEASGDSVVADEKGLRSGRGADPAKPQYSPTPTPREAVPPAPGATPSGPRDGRGVASERTDAGGGEPDTGSVSPGEPDPTPTVTPSLSPLPTPAPTPWWHQCVIKPDWDCDTWPDSIEIEMGSDPYDPHSTPEHWLDPYTCYDGADNDRDGPIDGADPGCASLVNPMPTPAPTPTPTPAPTPAPTPVPTPCWLCMQSISVDADISGNTSTALGPHTPCIETTAGSTVAVDITALGIPPYNDAGTADPFDDTGGIIGYQYSIRYDEANLAV